MHYRKYMYKSMSSSALEQVPSELLQALSLEASKPDLPLRLALL